VATAAAGLVIGGLAAALGGPGRAGS
jgi:hypothetical protein